MKQLSDAQTSELCRPIAYRVIEGADRTETLETQTTTHERSLSNILPRRKQHAAEFMSKRRPSSGAGLKANRAPHASQRAEKHDDAVATTTPGDAISTMAAGTAAGGFDLRPCLAASPWRCGGVPAAAIAAGMPARPLRLGLGVLGSAYRGAALSFRTAVRIQVAAVHSMLHRPRRHRIERVLQGMGERLRVLQKERNVVDLLFRDRPDGRRDIHGVFPEIQRVVRAADPHLR